MRKGIKKREADKNKTLVLGGGCFWCLEAVFKRVKGVLKITPGYAGGSEKNPNYEKISTGLTGHAEVIKINYDPKIITLIELLEVFFKAHDPTTQDRQGNDVGRQYRSIILYNDAHDREIVDKHIRMLNNELNLPITTEVRKLEKFYRAEKHHENYYENHKDSPYCRLVILPKLKKMKLE